MLLGVLTLALAAAQPSGPIGPSDVPAAVVDAARAARHAPLPDRITAVSEALLGVPYVTDPAGEGAPPDADPLARYDGFDCLTFVEEVLALSLAADPVQAGAVRRSLRYGDGPVRYDARHHFMELQWLPQAVTHGWLRETAASYGEVQVVERVIEPAFWATWHGRGRFELATGDFPTGTMRLEILPLDEARRVIATVRPGSLLLVVREDRAANPYWITHLGFVLGGERPVLRHASRLGDRVRDHDLQRYVDDLATWRRWPVAGIAVFEPVDPGPPRVAPDHVPARAGRDAGGSERVDEIRAFGSGHDPQPEPARR